MTEIVAQLAHESPRPTPRSTVVPMADTRDSRRGRPPGPGALARRLVALADAATDPATKLRALELACQVTGAGAGKQPAAPVAGAQPSAKDEAA